MYGQHKKKSIHREGQEERGRRGTFHGNRTLIGTKLKWLHSSNAKTKST